MFTATPTQGNILLRLAIFFDEFSNYLKHIAMCPEILLITGDFTWTAHQIVTPWPEGFLSFLTPLAYSAR